MKITYARFQADPPTLTVKLSIESGGKEWARSVILSGDEAQEAWDNWDEKTEAALISQLSK